MDFIHSREYLNAGDVVVVDSNYKANVLLTDDHNFAQYRAGREFRYHGGHYVRFPVRIVAPSNGHWNVTIDLGGGGGNLKYSIRVVRKS